MHPYSSPHRRLASRSLRALLSLAALASLTACQSQLQVDLAVSAPSQASAVFLAVPTVGLENSGSTTAKTYDTRYDTPLDLLPYSSGDQQHSDRLQLLDRDNVSGDFTGLRPLLDATSSYVKLSNGSQVPITLGRQPDYADISFSLSKSATSSDDSAHLIVTLELPFSLISLNGGTRYQLNPVIRVASQGDAGSISGTIAESAVTGLSCGSAAGSGVMAYVYKGSGVTPVDYYNDGAQANTYQPIAASILSYDATAGEYTFEIRYLPSGNYTVAWTCEADLDQPDSSDSLNFLDKTSVSVSAGNAATVSFN